MTSTHNVFDSALQTWKTEQASPWSRLKYKMTQANLSRHLPETPGRALDAGGGNGLEAIALARLGYRVDLVDSSPAMLSDAVEQATAAGVNDLIAVHQADVQAIPLLFATACFDVVLCHNVIQYVADVPAFLSKVVSVMQPGGVVSVLCVNRHSVPYKTAFMQNDLVGAAAQLDTHTFTTYLFDVPVVTFTAEELSALLRAAGLTVENYYGVRCLCDYWGTNEQKSDPNVFAELEALEFALTDRHPHKLLARYCQVIARKKKTRTLNA